MDKQQSICMLMDYAIEKVTKYRDIAPQAETLSKLRSGKVRKKKQRSRYVGQARVLNSKYVNKGLEKLAGVEAKRQEQQLAMEKKKRAAEERKTAKETLDRQWRADL